MTHSNSVATMTVQDSLSLLVSAQTDKSLGKNEQTKRRSLSKKSKKKKIKISSSASSLLSKYIINKAMIGKT